MDKTKGIVSTPLIDRSPQVWFPASLKQAWDLKAKYGSNADYIAGGTLIQLQREKGMLVHSQLISLARIPNINGIQMEATGPNERLHIGSFTSLNDCANHPFIESEWGILSTAASQIASPAVRNQSVIGGNVGYGVGDLIPALLVLDAQISKFCGGDKVVVENLSEYVGESTDAIITTIMLPANNYNHSFFRKVGRRKAFIPSIVTVAGGVEIDSDHVVKDVRLAIGGGDYLPHRLTASERLLKGNQLNKNLLDQLQYKITSEYQPESTPFASSNYCKQVAINLISSELTRLLPSHRRGEK